MSEFLGKVKGMCFSDESVLALLARRKKNTRRVITGDITCDRSIEEKPTGLSFKKDQDHDVTGRWLVSYRDAFSIKCPLCEVGDIIYVKEAIRRVSTGSAALQFARFVYRADMKEFNLPKDIYTTQPFGWDRWTSSRYMPRWAARIWQQVTSIRPERLQDISVADVRAEGYRPDLKSFSTAYRGWHIDEYSTAWTRLNGKRGYPWSKNNWVWVIGFRPATPELLRKAGVR